MTAAIISSFTFAQAAADKLPVERKRELIWLILFVLAAGITLLVVVMLLMRAWRRSVARLQEDRRQLSAALPPDIWKAGGDRLVAKMSPFPKPPAENDAAGADDAFDGDDDPEDDDDPFPPESPEPPEPPGSDDDDPRRGDQR